MARIRLRYIQEWTDPEGRTYRYFRRNGRRTPLPGLPGSREFQEAYAAALEATEPQQRPIRKAPVAGTFDALAAAYFASSTYLRLAPSTRLTYRGVIERMLSEHKLGHRRPADMHRDHVDKLLGRMANRPGAANEVLKKLRVLLAFGRPRYLQHDPTDGLRKFKANEFHAWTEDEIGQFMARWPVGSREYTAFALHLYTGQRRSDVVKMGWPDVTDGYIKVCQEKTGEKIEVPVHPDLARALAAWPRRHVTILTTAHGKPFAAAGYGNWFRDICRAAGLPEHCASHGLRKAAGRCLAEAGATEKEIAAILGHKTLQEVARYTRSANQRMLANSGMNRLPERTGGAGLSKLPEPDCQTQEKSSG